MCKRCNISQLLSVYLLHGHDALTYLVRARQQHTISLSTLPSLVSLDTITIHTCTTRTHIRKHTLCEHGSSTQSACLSSHITQLLLTCLPSCTPCEPCHVHVPKLLFWSIYIYIYMDIYTYIKYSTHFVSVHIASLHVFHLHT
jgi:hypothetical protein